MKKIIDFEAYKYVAPDIFHVVALVVVLLLTLLLYIICLPFMWFVPIQRLFGPLDDLIEELT